MELQLIAAKSANNVIGNGPDIPWSAKGEQKLFREITIGGTLIMGRSTFDSIGKPLPGRNTIILTRAADYRQPGCRIAVSVEDAIHAARSLEQPIYVAGGGEIYAQFLPLVDELHLTTIHVDCEGDVFFPDFELAHYDLIEEQHFSTNVDYTYQRFRKK